MKPKLHCAVLFQLQLGKLFQGQNAAPEGARANSIAVHAFSNPVCQQYYSHLWKILEKKHFLPHPLFPVKTFPKYFK
jgi:rhamnogalacturonyl hydrolase YesR